MSSDKNSVLIHTTLKSRPPKPTFGGRGKYCCIPGCLSTQYDQNKEKTKIGLFKFPNNEKKQKLFKLWANEIYRFRRKGGKDGFEITGNTRFCEFHFKKEDIVITLGHCIKKLKDNVISSIFDFRRKIFKKMS